MMSSKHSWKYLKPKRIFTSDYSILKPAEQMYSLPNRRLRRMESPISDSGIARHQSFALGVEIGTLPWGVCFVPSLLLHNNPGDGHDQTEARSIPTKPQGRTDPKPPASRNRQDGSCPPSNPSQQASMVKWATNALRRRTTCCQGPSTIRGHHSTKHIFTCIIFRVSLIVLFFKFLHL